MANKGTVYLIHFNEPYKGVSHYIGFTFNLTERLAQHRAGLGARLLQVVTEAGIEFEVVRQFEKVDRKFERKLKNRKKCWFLCPVCRPRRGVSGEHHFKVKGN